SSSPVPCRLLTRAILSVIVALVALPSTSRGEFIITFSQQGNDVVAMGSGTINLAALSPGLANVGAAPQLLPAQGVVEVGAGFPATIDIYSGLSTVTGPLGPGNQVITGNGDGMPAGLGNSAFFPQVVVVPHNYQSGSLSGSVTYANTTITDLGL